MSLLFLYEIQIYIFYYRYYLYNYPDGKEVADLFRIFVYKEKWYVV